MTSLDSWFVPSGFLSRIAGGGALVHRDLLVAGKDVRRAFPRTHKVEIAEFLYQLNRLIDHALKLIVVAHLDIAGERKVLAQRITGKSIVGQDAPQIRMIRKNDAIHVERLALEPVGGRINGNDR